MPKFPMSLASGEVPSHVPYGQASPANWSAPQRAIGGLGVEVERISNKWEDIDAKVRASREKLFTSQVMTGLDSFYLDFESKIGSNLGPLEVANVWKTVSAEYLNTQLANVQDETLKNTIMANAMLHVQTGAHSALKTATARVMQADEAAALIQFRALTAKGTPEAAQEAVDLLHGMTAAGYFSPAEQDRWTELIRKESLSNAFSRDLGASLSMTFDAVNQRQGIYKDATEVEQKQFLGAIRAEVERQEAKARQDMRDKEKAEERIAKQVAQESDDARLSATMEAVNGTYGLARLDQEAKAYRWTPAEYEHLREILVNPKSMKSDPDTLESAMLRARSVSVTQKDRDQFAVWYKGKKLSAEDYAKVDNEAQQNIRSGTDEAKSNLARSHAQAEQELRAGLGITGILESLTQDQKKSYSAALQELTERSAYLRGKEDPLAVVRDMIPRYQAIIVDNAALTIEQKTKLLRYKTPQELEAAKGQMSAEQYRIERQRLMDVGAYLPSFLRANMPETTTTPAKPKLTREKK